MKQQLLLIATVLLLGLGSTTLEKQYYSSPHFGEFEGVAQQLMHWEETYEKDGLVTFAALNHPSYFQYYYNQAGKQFQPEKSQFHHGEEIGAFQKRIGQLADEGIKRIAFGWSSAYAPPEFESIISQHYPHREKVQWFNAEAILFSKGQNNGLDPVFLSENNKDQPLPHWKQKELTTDSVSHKTLEIMDGEKEYSSTFEAPLEKLLTGISSKCSVEVALDFQKSPTASGELVLTFHRGEEKIGWHAASLAHFENGDSQEWNHILLVRAIPWKKQPDRVKAYLWRSNKEGAITIKNFRLAIFNPQKDLYNPKDFKRAYHLQ